MGCSQKHAYANKKALRFKNSNAIAKSGRRQAPTGRAEPYRTLVLLDRLAELARLDKLRVECKKKDGLQKQTVFEGE
mgnify:CR=1 FL=1